MVHGDDHLWSYLSFMDSLVAVQDSLVSLSVLGLPEDLRAPASFGVKTVK